MNITKSLQTCVAAVGLALTTPSHAATYAEQSFFNGWNLFVTNGTAAVVGATNNLFTTPQGQVLYSLTNNSINGIVNTNGIAPDAFDTANYLFADANGDINGNAAIHYLINATNLVPVVVTNSQGQYFITNTWPLLSSQWPTYMYPATTNVYPQTVIGTYSSSVVFNFQRGWKFGYGPAAYYVWDTTTNVFTFTATVAPGSTPVSGITNLPTSFTQGAELIRCHDITVNTNAVIVSELSLGQWKP